MVSPFIELIFIYRIFVVSLLPHPLHSHLSLVVSPLAIEIFAATYVTVPRMTVTLSTDLSKSKETLTIRQPKHKERYFRCQTL